MIELLVLFGLIVIPLSVFVVRSWRSRSLTPFAAAARGAVAGGVAGVLWAIGARVAMRAIAVAAGDEPEFTVGGTLFVLLAGVVLGVVLGLIFAAVRALLPGSAARQGLTFGGVLLALMLAPLVLFGPVEPDRPGVVGTASFGALFVLYGFVLGSVAGRLDHHLLSGRGSKRAHGDAKVGNRSARPRAAGPVL